MARMLASREECLAMPSSSTTAVSACKTLPNSSGSRTVSHSSPSSRVSLYNFANSAIISFLRS
eukprot:CAMPEP_0198218574 /NCGR_PEP_ID=MMETSP1445-20131203/69990_1 /TAXON_ID=36898 /ORGANISM="Pyramimonas sp., Strain CCMP2087" /LENGTH=62 /DNA_ID=CAMNT_0043895663 /DNA_START=111 /DNA_END=296 /DNA_ORIENTATION=-